MALLSLRRLTVDLVGANGDATIVHPVELEIQPGDTIGIVGESGSGKSVTWLAALGLQPPSMRVRGEVLLDGRNILNLNDTDLSRVRGGRIAMVFQDPTSSLNPVKSVGSQIGEAIATHRGLGGKELRSEVLRLLDSVGIADAKRRATQYPHEFSGGMNQRVMIAMALAGEPDLLIADEPTTALDVTIQAQILDLLRSVQSERGMALVLISHDLGVVADLCHEIAVMQNGRIVEFAPTDVLFQQPKHPYTRSLLACYPDFDGPRLAQSPNAPPQQFATQGSFGPATSSLVFEGHRP